MAPENGESWPLPQGASLETSEGGKFAAGVGKGVECTRRTPAVHLNLGDSPSVGHWLVAPERPLPLT